MGEHSASDPSSAPWSDLAPVLLTPVRLETRYLPDTTPPLLAIRVIPDDIARYDFEPELTAAEHAAGNAYWAAYAAGADPTAAWTQVQNEVGDARGAWAVEVTRPDSTVTDPGNRTTVNAATSLLLPDFFAFRGWRGGTKIFDVTGNPVIFAVPGNTVPTDLKLGPDWSSLGAAGQRDGPADQQPWTAASTWMINLAEAVRVGMAVTVPLTGTNLAFDSITVVGVRNTSADDGADRLARTLQGQLYTGGLGYPPAGSPTNNTDATRSQWTSAPAMRTPDQVSAAIAAAAPGLGQPGVTIADALGLPADVRPGVPGRRDLLAAPHATDPGDDDLTRRAHRVIAEYYSNFAYSDLLNSTTSDHFVDFVRAGGPLPVLRAGRQPYGLLPVTDLYTWQPASPPDVPDGLWNSVVGAWEGLNQRLDASPRLSADPRQDEDPVLLGILQRQPTAVQLRAVNGNHTLPTPGNPPVPADTYVSCVSPAFDLTPSTPASPGSPPAWPLAQMSRHTFLGPQDPHLLDDCVSASEVDDRCHQNGLYWAVQAYAALHWQGALLRLYGTDLPHWRSGTASLADTFQPLRDLEPDAAEDWAAVDAHLADAVTALGPRYDAWATSIATARLQATRDSGVNGVHLGMYGWVVDVEPRSDAQRENESGWTLAPSPQHAVTACVLFAGAEAHDSEAFNIDLSSAQVRRARTLLAGLRNGSTLEELLGYQLERALHNNQLDTAITALRQHYPLPVAPVTEVTSGVPDTARTARLITNGEAVRRDSAGAAACIRRALKIDDQAAEQAITQILGELDTTVDAAGDALLAESVHHLIGGSPLRAGLTLDTIGKVRPAPENLDSVTTPTAAVTVTNHVALAVSAGDPAQSGWYPSQRAALDPAAEAIAEWTLGDPTDWRIDLTDPASGTVTSRTPIELQLSAVDFAAELTDPPDSSALAARARVLVAAAADSTIAVHRADGFGGADAAVTLAAAIRTVLTRTQPVWDPATILDPAATSGPVSDATVTSLTELDTRVTDWWTAVQRALKTEPTAVASGLELLARLGLQGARFDAPPSALAQLLDRWGSVTMPALPTQPWPADAAAWLTKIAAAVRAAAGEWFTAATITSSTAGDLPGEQPTTGAGDDDVADWIAAHAPMCAGTSALADLLLVSGACGAANRPTWIIRQRLAAASTGPWAPPSSPGAWIGSADPGGRSAIALTAAHVGDPALPQQMWVSIDHWDEVLPLRFAVASEDATAGHQHDAAVGLRFDSPDSRAPHALLLVVPPIPGQAVALADVQAAVEQTLNLSMLRPLDSDDLPEMFV